MSETNNCIHMIGRYSDGVELPSADGSGKWVSYGGFQMCALNCRFGLFYGCPYTTQGGKEQCEDYRFRQSYEHRRVNVYDKSTYRKDR